MVGWSVSQSIISFLQFSFLPCQAANKFCSHEDRPDLYYLLFYKRVCLSLSLPIYRLVRPLVYPYVCNHLMRNAKSNAKSTEIDGKSNSINKMSKLCIFFSNDTQLKKEMF